MNMSWTLGAALSLAINKDMFDGSKACGTCIMYRGVWAESCMHACCVAAGLSLRRAAHAGTGGGIGVTPVSTTQWIMGFVNNICPECSRGALDQDIDGDGRWRIQWCPFAFTPAHLFATQKLHVTGPCLVQVCSALQCWRVQDALRSGGEALLLVLARGQQHQVSCHACALFMTCWQMQRPEASPCSARRIPVSAVAVKINGKWLDLQRSWTNSWPYHRVRVRLS
jgi:hypothetical protein